MLVASFVLLFSTYFGSSETRDVPPPPTSHSPAYQEASKVLSRTLNVSRNPCDYEYACERYAGRLVLADAQNNVYDAVYKALNSSRGKVTLAVLMQVTSWSWHSSRNKKYELYVDACVASKRNYSSVLDPDFVVALMRNFTEVTGLRFPLIDGRPVAEWPNGTTLGRALGYLGRISGSNPLFQTEVSSNIIDPEGPQPYYLFVGNVVPEPDFRKMQFGVHKVEFANVGRYIPKDVLTSEVKAIERLGATINNVSGGMQVVDDFAKAFNPISIVGADSAFGDFINFTRVHFVTLFSVRVLWFFRFLTSYTSSSTSAVQQRVRDANYKISLSAPEYFFKLKALLSEGNEYGIKAHTLHNFIYAQLLLSYERLFVEPKTIRRISIEDALLVEMERHSLRAASRRDRARGEVVLPLSDTAEEAEYHCVIHTAIGTMPFASGRVFIDAVLPTEKDRREHLRAAERMVSGILDALRSMIDQITWMTDESKGHAYYKLNKMVKNIGYPEFVVDDELLAQYYSDLDLASAKNNIVLAGLELGRFDRHKSLEKLTRRDAVDRTEFSIPINFLNANYADSRNSINVPLAIIQKPLFDKDWPASLNFGGIGFVIGHEMMHGFDTNGVQWDSIGRLSPWLDDKSQKAFDEMNAQCRQLTSVIARKRLFRAGCLIHEYGHFCPSKNDTSRCLSGNLTQTENIADNGGIRAAFRAYENEIGLSGPDPLLPGRVTNQFSHDQLFFLNSAHDWCAEKSFAVRIDPTDVHSPPKYRVHGALQNFGAFAAAFNCQKGSEYAPKKHCNVWISDPTAENEENS